MITDWPSTRALSVYNALRFNNRPMAPAEICEFLCDEWDDTIDGEYVKHGIAFLLARGFVRLDGAMVAPTLKRRLVRANDDAELAYGRI